MTRWNADRIREYADGPHRVGVTLWGLASLAVAAWLLVVLLSLMAYEPQTQADAHAMAHSGPAIAMVAIFGIGGFGIAGLVLFSIAYLDRRWLSSIALLVVGVVALFASGHVLGLPLSVAAVVSIVLGFHGFGTNP